MAQQFPEINDRLRRFIEAQHMFFVGTAARDGRINVSPKGLDSLRVRSSNEVVWLNHTGSGNESAAHVRDTPRMTLMFCSFEGAPLILRLYGQARVVHEGERDWDDLVALFPPTVAARNVFVLDVDLVQTSCGFGVPRYDLHGQRDDLVKWAQRKGPDGIHEYWATNNAVSLDGSPTGIPGAGDTDLDAGVEPRPASR